MLKLNDITAFIIEIVSIIILARWAYLVPNNTFQKILLSGVAVIAFALIWSLFFAPTAKFALHGQLRWILEFAILFLPFLQFLKEKTWLTIIAGLVIAINLFIQASYGRGQW